MFCINCGINNPSQANFCFKCGVKTISTYSDLGGDKFEGELIESATNLQSRRPLFVSFICIYLIFTGVVSFLLAFSEFSQFGKIHLIYNVKHYSLWKYLTIITVGVVCYKFIFIAVRLWKSRLKQVPLQEARRLVRVFFIGSFLGIVNQFTFIGFNLDFILQTIIVFFLGCLLIFGIYFYLKKSKSVANYFNLDIGPFKLTLQPTAVGIEFSEIESEIRHQIEKFTYKSDSFINVPIFSFRGGLVAIFRHSRLYFFRSRELAEEAVNKNDPDSPLNLSEMFIEIPCNLKDA